MIARRLRDKEASGEPITIENFALDTNTHRLLIDYSLSSIIYPWFNVYTLNNFTSDYC